MKKLIHTNGYKGGMSLYKDDEEGTISSFQISEYRNFIETIRLYLNSTEIMLTEYEKLSAELASRLNNLTKVKDELINLKI